MSLDRPRYQHWPSVGGNFMPLISIKGKFLCEFKIRGKREHSPPPKKITHSKAPTFGVIAGSAVERPPSEGTALVHI